MIEMEQMDRDTTYMWGRVFMLIFTIFMLGLGVGFLVGLFI